MWKEIKSSRCKSYHLNGEPELIHIIKTGFENKYMVVYEDAYELVLGQVEFYTKEQLENKFKLHIDI